MTQGEIERLPIQVQQNLGALESRVMSDIVRRIQINGEITSAADWQINRLYQIGVSKKAIKKYIAEALNLNKKEIKKLYHDSLYNEYIRNEPLYKEKGAKWISFDKNKELQELIGAVEEQTNKEMKNITQSLGFAVRGADGKVIQTPLMDFYRETLDDAMNDIASGVFDYRTVLNRTIQTMTNSGLRTIDYESGWSNRVEVAGRRSVMTGFNQLQARVNDQVAEQLKTEYFEVSWHGGARPTHQAWQGVVYNRKQLKTVCGLGSVTGLCGANCYHQYNAFIPGVSVRTYTDEQLHEMNAEENRKKSYNRKEYTTYEALQKQREMETLMRKQRQDVKLLNDGKADGDDILAAKVRYRVTMDKYTDFSGKMKLPQQKERIYMDGLGKMAPSNKQYQGYLVEQEQKKAAEAEKMKQKLVGQQVKILQKYGSHESIMISGSNEDMINYSNLVKKTGMSEKDALVFVYKNVDNWETVLKSQGSAIQKELSTKSLSALSKHERDALSTWSGGSYVAINNHLRYGNHLDDEMKDTVKTIEKALEKTRLDKDLIAKRGVNTNALENMLRDVGGWKEDIQSAVGHTVSDKGFFATSSDKSGGFGGDVKFVIHCPKGTKAAYIADIAKNPDERELLLQRDSKFRIIKAEETKNKWGEPRYKLWLEVVV